MSCSARLPVYILIIGAFFPQYPSLMLMAIYSFGIVMAIVSALLFKKILFKQPSAPFVMELPPYRLPTLKVTLSHMWDKAAEYLKKVGGTILVAVVIIWALMYYPQNSELKNNYQMEVSRIEQSATDKTSIDELIKEAEINYQKQHLEQSFIYNIGLALEPAMTPIGLDWKMGISIVTGVVAKEIVVSTLGVIYQTEEGESLVNKLREESKLKEESTAMNNLRAISFLIFILIYFPCVGVVAAVKKETGGWKWPIFMIVYTTTLAWVLSFVVFQVGKFLIGIL